MAFSIDEVADLSGLTVGQIEQAISRWGIGIWARPEPGLARRFLPADLFTLIAVSELLKLGLGWRGAREALAAFPLCELGEDGMPVDICPGYHGPDRQIYYLIYPADLGFASVITSADNIASSFALMAKTPSAILFDATAIADRVERAIKKRRTK